MKTHITLVNPPTPSGATGHLPFAILGLGYLAAVLEEHQFEVDVIDCQVTKLSKEEVQKKIGKSQPSIVGITSTTLTYKSGLQIAEIAKETCPNCLTVMGGPHVTFWDYQAMQECPFLDVIVRREGENTLLELAQKVDKNENYGDVLGLTYRKDGVPVRNPDRPYIENLDELPFPARHLWPMERLREYEDILYLVTTRGCVYWCEFCSTVRMHGRKYRMRSPKNVVDELEFLNKTYGVTKYTFCDDAFTVDQERTKELCREILNRGLKIQWNCGTRVDMITEDLLREMKNAGCISVWFGVESGSQNVLDCMNKGISTEQTVRSLNWVREVGLRPVPNVILGFPGETKESAWKTIKFVEKISPDDLAFYNIATPFPGTPMFDAVKGNNWLKIEDFDKYDTATPAFETPWLSMKELTKIRLQAFHHFYLRPHYIVKNLREGHLSSLATTLTNLLGYMKIALTGAR